MSSHIASHTPTSLETKQCWTVLKTLKITWDETRGMNKAGKSALEVCLQNAVFSSVQQKQSS